MSSFFDERSAHELPLCVDCRCDLVSAVRREGRRTAGYFRKYQQIVADYQRVVASTQSIAARAAAGRLTRDAYRNLIQEAATAGDFQQATAALAEVKQAIAGAKGAEKLEWKPVADLSQLMKQVPIVNNNLRRTVTGKRFKQSLDASAGQAATLAALAQASSFDTSYCDSKDAEAKWARLCGEMRDDAAEVQAAIRKGDQAAATAGLEKLAKTCDSCHHAFRDK